MKAPASNSNRPGPNFISESRLSAQSFFFGLQSVLSGSFSGKRESLAVSTFAFYATTSSENTLLKSLRAFSNVASAWRR